MDEVERLLKLIDETERRGEELVEVDREELRAVLSAARRAQFWQRVTEGASGRVTAGSSDVHEVFPKLFGPKRDARKATKHDVPHALLRFAYLTGQLAPELGRVAPEHPWTFPALGPMEGPQALEVVASEGGWPSLRAARAALDRFQDRIRAARMAGLPESPLLPLVRLPADPK